MNQEQNNLNQNNFNMQANNGTPNNQPLNNQSLNNTFNPNVAQNPNVNQSTYNKQPINPQPQQTQNYQQPINQMNIGQATQQPMNTFESGNVNVQNSNSKPVKKMNLGLIIGIVAVIVIAIIIAIVSLFNKEVSFGELGDSNNNTKLNVIIYVGGKNGNFVKTEDGADWKKIELETKEGMDPSTISIDRIYYLNGEYILHTWGKYYNASSYPIFYSSTNGIDWKLMTFSNATFPRGFHSINYINNNYCYASTSLYCGETLNNATDVFKNDNWFIQAKAYVQDYAYGNNKLVVHVERSKKYWEIEDNSSGKAQYFYTSTNGQDFEKTETNMTLDAMEFGNNVFVGISAFENYGIYKSDDGINWTKALALDDWTSNYGIIYSDNSFYIWYDDKIYVSNDGTNWKEIHQNKDNQSIVDFSYKNGIYAYASLYTEEDPETYAYVHTSKVFISTDGTNWLEKEFEHNDYGAPTIYVVEK